MVTAISLLQYSMDNISSETNAFGLLWINTKPFEGKIWCKKNPHLFLMKFLSQTNR